MQPSWACASMSFFFQLTPTSVHVEQTACSCKGCCCCGAAAAAAATGGATGGAALQPQSLPEVGRAAALQPANGKPGWKGSDGKLK